MKKFKIVLNEVMGGYATIEAKNEEEAREKAQRLLDDEGVEGFEDFDTTHRETNIFEVEEE